MESQAGEPKLQKSLQKRSHQGGQVSSKCSGKGEYTEYSESLGSEILGSAHKTSKYGIQSEENEAFDFAQDDLIK